MLAGEDVAGASHVGGELVDLVEPAVDDVGRSKVAQIADDEVIGRRAKPGNLRSTPRTQKPSCFRRFTMWLPIKPPAPQTSARFIPCSVRRISRNTVRRMLLRRLPVGCGIAHHNHSF